LISATHPPHQKLQSDFLFTRAAKIGITIVKSQKNKFQIPKKMNWNLEFNDLQFEIYMAAN
jgi:hypothetical protein